MRIDILKMAFAAALVGSAMVPGVGVAAQGSDARRSEPEAVARLLDAMRSGVIGANPEAGWRSATLEAEVAELRAGAGAGAPTLSWQREGIGPGFDERANAADYLRVSLPFDAPWHRGSIRSLDEAADHLLAAGHEVNRLAVAAAVGRLWLDLAAETERVILAEERARRFGQALEIQERRYELGEISGSERTQLELEAARESSLVQRLERRRLALERELDALTAAAVTPPRVGDLERLVAATTSPAVSEAKLLSRLLASGPSLASSKARSEAAAAGSGLRRRVAWGRPEVEVEWERIPDLAGSDGFDAAGLRLSLPLPFGRQGRQAILAAALRAEAAAAEHERQRRRLSSRLRSELEAALSAEATLRSLQPSIDQIPSAEHSVSEQFRLGAISYVVYLDGLSRLDEVRQEAIETRSALLNARLSLGELLGTDDYFPLPRIPRKDAS